MKLDTSRFWKIQTFSFMLIWLVCFQHVSKVEGSAMVLMMKILWTSEFSKESSTFASLHFSNIHLNGLYFECYIWNCLNINIDSMIWFYLANKNRKILRKASNKKTLVYHFQVVNICNLRQSSVRQFNAVWEDVMVTLKETIVRGGNKKSLSQSLFQICANKKLSNVFEISTRLSENFSSKFFKMCSHTSLKARSKRY